MSFLPGVDGRAATEFTFIPVSHRAISLILLLMKSVRPNAIRPRIRPEPQDR